MDLRSYFEDLEHQTLAPYAAKSSGSQGRRYPETASATRTCFQRDRDRIIHAKSFRRLKHKTQVFVATDSDHYRSRLTHTLEVAQISRHLARILRLNEDLAEAIALAHDLGHPPFGHSGERALDELMADFGGFEHNIQSLRVVEELEQKYPGFPGLNLSFEVREGLKKHQTPWDHPDVKAEEVYLTLEAQVVNLADEIAYNNHDLDDGLGAGILVESDLSAKVSLWREAKASVESQYANLEPYQLKTLINSALISRQIEDVVARATSTLKKVELRDLTQLQGLSTPIVAFSDAMRTQNIELRKYLYTEFYSHEDIYKMNKKGQRIIRVLFETFSEDFRLLPVAHRARISTENSKQRVVCDYIAGMTDGFALKEHAGLF